MQIPKVVTDILRVAAPTLLVALGGPFGPIAASLATTALAAWLGPATGELGGTTVAAGVAQPPSVGAATPSEVVNVVYTNANDPKFLLDLKKVEIDLQKYERDMDFKFADLEVKDKQRAGDFQTAAGISDMVFSLAKRMLFLDYLISGVVILGCGLLLSGVVHIGNAELTTATFGLVGVILGRFSARADQATSFYFGSSKGSEDKSTQIASTVKDLGVALGDAAKNRPVPLPPVAVPDAPFSGDDPNAPPASTTPATPAPAGMVLELLPELTKSHRHFAEGVYWALTSKGIAIEGAAAQGTPGEPVTIRKIWKQYGDLSVAAAKRFGVPVELIIATIATESAGNASAVRVEPKINDRSVGLMQTLVKTAQGALGRPSLTADDLLDPATSINAGTAYIAQQRSTTHFDAPKVAAAYNAGSIRKDKADANPWKLVCYPAGTGRHVTTFVSWFNDAMVVSGADGWGKAEGVPSFASCILANPPT